MKKIHYHLLILMVLSTLMSCEDFMDVHQEYIEGGEIIYAPKADSVAFIAGKERILFRFWLYNSPNVKSVNLYWNNDQDSLIVPVTPTTGLDSTDMILPDMPEKSYTFNVRTIDKYGHASLTITDFGTSYGEVFQSSLSYRRIREISITDQGGEISWYSAAGNLVFNEVRYEKTDGTKAVVQMPASENTLLCPVAKTGSVFEYRSLYIPEEETIDTFAVDWAEYGSRFPDIYQYDKSDWTIVSYSDQEESDGGGVTTLLDGDLNNWWHSQYNNGGSSLPHWVVIDLTSSKKICRIDTWRRPGSTDAKTVWYFVNNDPDPNAASWVKIAEGVFSSDDQLTIDIAKPDATLQGRYLKLVLPDSNRSYHTSIAEISLYGN
jgi:hypothetical protein